MKDIELITFDDIKKELSLIANNIISLYNKEKEILKTAEEKNLYLLNLINQNIKVAFNLGKIYANEEMLNLLDIS